MKILFLITTFLFLNSSVFAGSATFGPNIFEITEGCAGIGNIIINMDGYKVSSKVGGEESLLLCGPIKYLAEDRMGILEQVAKRGLEANCFKTHIDKTNKVLEFQLLPNSKKVTQERYSSRTYTVEGHETFADEPSERSSVNHVCVIDQSYLEWPYTEMKGF